MRAFLPKRKASLQLARWKISYQQRVCTRERGVWKDTIRASRHCRARARASDVKVSGGAPTISPPYTLSDYLFLDLGDPIGDVTVQSLRSASANIAQSGFI